MKDEYNHNIRSKYLIKLHFVFAVKYRKRLLTDSLNDDMLQIMSEIAKQKGFKIDTIQSDVDHLHILVDISPSFSAFEVAHQLKQISTYRIYKKYRIELKIHFGLMDILSARQGMRQLKQYENTLKHKDNLKTVKVAYIP